MRIAFLLAKDPAVEHVGDTALMNQLLDLVGSHHDVSIVSWAKPPVSPARIALRAAVRRRSLLHARYDEAALKTAIEDVAADAYVAVHHYMAEAFLRSGESHKPLFVVDVVPEAPVWRDTRGVIGRLQATAIERDETRVIRRATAVGAYDAADAHRVADLGARRAVWLQLTLPPREASDIRGTPPRLVVLGDRRWAPNADAWRRMLDLWPQISAGIPRAELIAVGHQADDSPVRRSLPDGVRDLGFVDDLDATLRSCRALAAPISTGGGVRVKLLEAAAVGLPVVATSAAAGSLTDLFGIRPVDDDAAFVAECRRLLSHAEEAAIAGHRLYAVNAAHWEFDRPQQSVQEWLQGP